jgi:outer membrane biosynthesis protein TonB
MGKLLTILGADEQIQKTLPADLFMAEKVIVGLQEIYSKAPESPKKNQLALAIAEAVRLIMAKLNPYLVKEEKAEEQQTKAEDRKLPDEPRERRPQPPRPMPPEIPDTPQDKPEEAPKEEPKPEEEKPKETPKDKPKDKSKPTPPSPPPPPSNPHKKVEDEVMTCKEIKDAIKGLTLLVKMGDTEAKEIVQILKNKYKSQNCQ